jgi:hypothetical protein
VTVNASAAARARPALASDQGRPRLASRRVACPIEAERESGFSRRGAVYLLASRRRSGVGSRFPLLSPGGISMAINTKKVVVGGLAAGVFFIVVDLLSNLVLIGRSPTTHRTESGRQGVRKGIRKGV